MRSAVVTRPVAGQRADRAGIGLRLPHLAEVAAGAISPSWLEVHPENFLANPHAHELLLQVAHRCEISAHTVGLSVGSAEGVDREHLARIRRFVDELDPFLVSGHLAWSTHRGMYLNDLLPLPYDDETLRVVAAHVHEVQDALGRPYVVENPASYVGFGASTMTEVDFLAELAAARAAGCCATSATCYLSAANMGYDAYAYIDAFPVNAVSELHLGGFTPEPRRRRRRGPHRHACSPDRGIRVGSVRPCAAAFRSAADVDRMGQRPSDVRAADRRGAARGRSCGRRVARKRAACCRSLICKTALRAP